MRKRVDDESEKTGLNFTLLATPAEGLSGRFVRIDRKQYGELPGVTDRDYYTNSFHVPVYYPIKAYQKIALEAPYHAPTNAGHISYIEMDGDTTKNLEAFESVIRAMKNQRIRRITGYLVGTIDRWNNAKCSEERDRLKHGI